MSARRLFAAALAAGLLGAAGVARAQDTVRVKVGGDLSGRAGQYIDVPVTVDVSGAPGLALGSYTATFSFNQALLEYISVAPGSFAAPTVNTAHASDSGRVVLTAIQPAGATGAVQIFVVRLYVLADTGATPITVSFSQMSATAGSASPFANLLPYVTIANGTFCRSLGRWGDVNNDGLVNSFDALLVLSYDVGDSIPLTDNPVLGDVDGDGNVNSRDALIILSYAVGLPVTGTRVMLVAAGSCGTGAATTLAITPDSVELQVGQEVPVAVSALDTAGRAVPVDSVSWSSSSPSVADFDVTTGAIQGRGPGVATLTVQLGPGVMGTLKVSVLARRTTWYVDILRARFAPAQTGSQNLPMEFIGDALAQAHNGDTVRIASGTYEEIVSDTVAAVLLGDTASHPVIDPRGAPSWYNGAYALYLNPRAGAVELAHLDVKSGWTYLDAHDIRVHDVRYEGLDTPASYALEAISENYTPPGAPAARGPMLTSVPLSLGNVLIDSVAISGDSLYWGILVTQADSAVIRHSSVRRTIGGTSPSCGAGPGTEGGIVVEQASVALAQYDTVVNPLCQGIGLFDDNSSTLVNDLSTVSASHNLVVGAPGTGIALGARLVSSDHNVVRGSGKVGSLKGYGASTGIRAYNYSLPPDTVWSTGDSIVNAGGRGFAVDTAAKAVIDSLIVAGAGLDSSYYNNGVTFGPGGRYFLSHSRILGAYGSDGVYYYGEHTNLHSHGNYIKGAGEYGIGVLETCPCAPPVRPAPSVLGGGGPQRVGPYTGGPDTLISVGDTISKSASYGVYLEYGVYALLDSTEIDSSGSYGAYVYELSRGTFSNSTIRGNAYGLYLYYIDTLALVGDSVLGNSGEGAYVYNYNAPDSTRVTRSVFAGNASNGLYLYYANAVVDSSVFTGSPYGINVYYYAGVRVHDSRFSADSVGLWVESPAGQRSYVDSSNFVGNFHAGVRNDAALTDTLYAANNWWNDANGPACNPTTTGLVCSGGASADSIYRTVSTGMIVFAPNLAAQAATPAPPARAVAAVAGRAIAPVVTAGRPAALPPEAERAANVAANQAALAARRTTHQAPPAWHAPSKARSHAVQIVVRKRT